MGFLSKIAEIFAKIFGKEPKKAEKTEKEQEMVMQETLYKKETNQLAEKEEELITTLWDLLEIKEHTQAYHIIAVTSYDEWLDMQEIKKRIIELFGVSYKNEKSLYPYIKTLVDIGLLEMTNAGGKRKWRKKELLLKILIKKLKKKEKEATIILE